MASSERGKERRRILDFLNDGEELGTAAAPRSPSARSLLPLPRFRWPRMYRTRRKGAGGKGEVEEEVAVEKGSERGNLGGSACATAVAGGDSRRPTDLGVGLSLVFLLAKTSDEFTRMAKVRGEMETLLREFKQQVRSTATDGDGDGQDDVSGAARNVESAASSCLTDGNEIVNARTSSEDQATSSGMEAAMSQRCCEKSSEDALEDEFHAELQRLQVNYGYSSDTPPFLPEDHDADAEPSDDMSDNRRGGYNDHDGDSGEDAAEAAAADDDDDDYDGSEYHGVSAVELERRLHELLHQRNQERIEELESALRRAEKKLVERESEACLWKDTARLALRQDEDEDDEPQCRDRRARG